MNSGHSAHSKWADTSTDSPLPMHGMQVSVTQLRSAGAKKRGESAEGYIASEEVTNHSHMAFLSRTQLNLYRTADRQRGTLLKPLFDAHLLQWDSRGLFLQGWEIELNERGHPVQQVQIWCVIPLATSSKS